MRERGTEREREPRGERKGNIMGGRIRKKKTGKDGRGIERTGK